MNDLVDQALTCIHDLQQSKNLTTDLAIGTYLGVNSAFLTHLRRGVLRPTLYRALIDQGLMPPPPPMVEIPMATAALMMSVAKWPKPKKPRKPVPKRAPRISIQKENMELAATAIIKNLNPDDVQLLIDVLIRETNVVEAVQNLLGANNA